MSTETQNDTELTPQSDISSENDTSAAQEKAEQKAAERRALINELKELSWQGLWKNNPGLVQLLGLCPLLAVTSTVTNALGLAVATLFVLVASNTTVSLVRNQVPKEIRIPVFVLIIAAFVTCVQLLLNAYAIGLYQSLGIFLPLIVTNCAIIGRAEAYASKNTVGKAAFDGLMMGLGFAAVLLALGAIREVLGQGTLFDGADLLLGSWATSLRIEVFQLDYQFIMMILPPGAFITMGFLIAFKNKVDEVIAARKPKSETKKIERVRVSFDG